MFWGLQLPKTAKVKLCNQQNIFIHHKKGTEVDVIFCIYLELNLQIKICMTLGAGGFFLLRSYVI